MKKKGKRSAASDLTVKLMSCRLLGILRSRLVESGWNDLVYAYATGMPLHRRLKMVGNMLINNAEMARNKNQDNVTMETLLENTADYARSK